MSRHQRRRADGSLASGAETRPPGGPRPEGAGLCLAYVRLVFVLLALIVLVGQALAQDRGGVDGALFMDGNGNGVRDLGDAGIPNARFTVFGPEYARTVETDALGRYQALDLAPGSYTIVPPLYDFGLVTTGSALGTIDFDIGPGDLTHINIGFHEECVTVNRDEIKILWRLDGNGVPTGAATISLPFQNNNPWAIGWVYFYSLTPGVSFGSFAYAPAPQPVPPGGQGLVTATITGAQPGQPIYFTVAYHTMDLVTCCEDYFCIEMPECECYQDVGHFIRCLPNGDFDVEFAIQNLYPLTISQIYVIRPGEFAPIVFPVSLAPGGIWSFHQVISNPAFGGTTQCWRIMFYAGGQQCCVKDLCLKFPVCYTCDDRPAFWYAKKPRYRAVNPAGQSYNGAAWAPMQNMTVAAVTCWSFAQADPVVGYKNLAQYQCNPNNSLSYNGPDWARQLDWNTTPVAPPAIDPNAPSQRGFHNGIGPDRPDVLPVPADCQWSKQYLGTVFPLTFDDRGNLYVGQTSCFNADYAPLISAFNARNSDPPHLASPNEAADGRLHGRIFKIAPITGKVTIFNNDVGSVWNGMPSASDPNITSSYPSPPTSISGEGFPEVGDVTFDYDNNQIFATCMDDGKIYRYDMAGTKLGSYDPWVNDTGAAFGDGFASRSNEGEVIWAIKYHRGRLYFSRWMEDFDNIHPTATTNNQVWSIPVNAGGTFPPDNSEVLEVETPDLPVGTGNGSAPRVTAPISDITFTSETDSTHDFGRMVLAERGMGGNWSAQNWWNRPHASGPNRAFSNTYPHRSRGLEYECDPSTHHWRLVGGSNPNSALKFQLGTNGANSAGGLDFDFDNRGCVGPNLGNRLWFMCDFINFTSWYGLQGIPLTGGSTAPSLTANSLVIDLDGLFSDTAGTGKNLLGDVEIPCAKTDIGGTTKWCDYPPNIARLVTYDVRTAAGVVVFSAEMTPEASGAFRLTLPPDLPAGSYVLRAKSSHWLRKGVAFELGSAGATTLVVELYNGDVDRDNEVGIGDFAALSAAYNTGPGDPEWLEDADLSGDEYVDIGDYAILSSNYGRVGDD